MLYLISARFIMEIHCHCLLSSQGKQSPQSALNSSNRVWGEARLLLPSLSTSAPAQAGSWLQSSGFYRSKGLKLTKQCFGGISKEIACLNTLREGQERWWVRMEVEGGYPIVLAVPVIAAQLGARFRSCCFKMPCLASWNREEGWKDTSPGSQLTFASFTVTIRKCS